MEIKNIIIKHVNGIKLNQIEEFNFNDNDVITLGRSEDSLIRFDSDKELGVSRNHAIIRKGNTPGQFFVEDTKSMNGVLVNEEKINGSREIFPGDNIQLGLKGPKFQFDLDPRPAGSKATELMTITPATEEISIEPANTPAANAKTGIGKETFERAIVVERKRSMTNFAAILGGLILLVGALGFTFKDTLFPAPQDVIIPPPPPTNELDAIEISKQNMKKVVMIETAWKLVHAQNGDDIYHEYLTYVDDATGVTHRLPAFIEVEPGVVEPSLGFRNDVNDGEPISSAGTGTGFVVGKDGLIMTNKHVATPWITPYSFPEQQGILLSFNGKEWIINGLIESPQNWVPSRTTIFGREPISGRGVTGETTYLDVVFGKTEQRHRGSISTVSSEHDLALVKINLTGTVEPVKFASRSSEAQEGENVLCMGFPSLSPDAIKVTKDESSMNNSAKVVPSATLTDGIISKIIRSTSDASLSSSQNDIFNFVGDYYQTTLGSSFGNSGGPVFNKKGEVIGIFTKVRADFTGGRFTYLVPSKYALSLMSTETVIK